MKSSSFRVFAENNQQFSIHVSANNATWIQSIHPYDETEYHYAYRTAFGKPWGIYLNGRKVSTMDDADCDLIAQKLMEFDKASGLIPHIAKD